MCAHAHTHTQCQVRTPARSNFPQLLTCPQSHTFGVPSHEFLQVVAKLNALPRIPEGIILGRHTSAGLSQEMTQGVSKQGSTACRLECAPLSPCWVTCCGSLGRLLQLFSQLGKEDKIVLPHWRGTAHHCQGLGKLSIEVMP